MTQLTERLDRFEDRLRSMEAELASSAASPARKPSRAPTPAPAREPEPPIWEMFEPVPRRARAAPARSAAWSAGLSRATVPGTGPSRPPREPLDLSRAARRACARLDRRRVTLLGIVFFFVLAVDRGWIGPTARVTARRRRLCRARRRGALAARAATATRTRPSRRPARHRGLLRDAARRGGALRPDPGARRAGRGRRDRRRRRGGRLAWRSETLASLGLVGAILAPSRSQCRTTSRRSARRSPVSCSRRRPSSPCSRNWRGLLVASVVCHGAAGARTRRRQHAHTLPVAIAFWLVSRPARSGSRFATRSRICRQPAHVQRGVRRLVGRLALRRPRPGHRAARRRARLRAARSASTAATATSRRCCGRSR